MKKINAKLTLSSSDKSISLSIKIREIDKKEQWKNALVTFAFFCLLSILFIPIPLIHFFLPPGFFLLGIFFAYKKYFKNIALLETQVKCPACEKSISIKECFEKQPLFKEITCPHCLSLSQLNAP